MKSRPLYDAIGLSYGKVRRADPSIVDRLHAALWPAGGSKLLDVAAGTGNYSAALAQRGWRITSVEPSAVMLNQRKKSCGIDWVASYAEDLPIQSHSMDAVVCVSALHHLADRKQALSEMNRVVGHGPIVLFTRDPRVAEPCWLETYFPEVWAESQPLYARMNRLAEEAASLTGKRISLEFFELPSTLDDYFAASGWNRPEIYLDERVRTGMSPFARVGEKRLSGCLERLRADLASRVWDKKYGSLRRRTSFNAGYYLLTAR